jgi:hypothetical protein
VKSAAAAVVGLVLLALACKKPTTTTTTTMDAAPPASPAASGSPLTDAADASADAAAPVAVSEMRILAAADVPKDIKLSKQAKAIGWTDKNGENVAVLTMAYYATMEDHDALKNYAMTVEHVAYPPPSLAKKVLSTVKDSRENCDDYDMRASFRDEALSVTDLDDDGFGELTFAYYFKCYGHHLAWTQKLVLLEDGTKHTLSSITPLMIDPATAHPSFQIDPTFKSDASSAAAFLDHAKKMWLKIPSPTR